MHVGEMCTCHTSHTHSPHTSRDAPCGVCLGVWRVVFWPPPYHDTFQTCQTWRVGVCMLARCELATRRTHTHHTRVEMHLVACVWEYGVLFFCQVGAWSTTLP